MPDVTGILLRANERDAKGRVFTADALRRMAARNPKQLAYDEEQGALVVRIVSVKAPRPNDPPNVVARADLGGDQ